MTERRADDATRDVQAWLKCFYMQDKIGEEYEGTVAGVTGFGLFVALDDVYVEGLLHVTELGNDYFNFDKARHEMAGERTGVRYRLGDRLRVKVSRVDLETTRIDFVLAEFGARREPIPEEFSIVPEKYREKGQHSSKPSKSSSKGGAAKDDVARGVVNKQGKSSGLWRGEKSTSNTQEKKSGVAKKTTHRKGGAVSAKPKSKTKARSSKR
jgi:ribonuclease R